MRGDKDGLNRKRPWQPTRAFDLEVRMGICLLPCAAAPVRSPSLDRVGGGELVKMLAILVGFARRFASLVSLKA
jgi:uncharacterized membrane protein YphA (DoxX/SURF4 family)